MSSPLRVLIVEDNEDDALLIIRELARRGYVPQHQRVDTSAATRQALETGQWDVIIADYAMPQFNGSEALGIVKSCGLDIPFIIVSGAIGEQTAIAAMKAGAHDYVMKSALGRRRAEEGPQFTGGLTPKADPPQGVPEENSGNP